MRLLEQSQNGMFSFTHDLVGDDQIPPYAILSHTWGADYEEVTYKDVISEDGESKVGFPKDSVLRRTGKKRWLKVFLD